MSIILLLFASSNFYHHHHFLMWVCACVRACESAWACTYGNFYKIWFSAVGIWKPPMAPLLYKLLIYQRQRRQRPQREPNSRYNLFWFDEANWMTFVDHKNKSNLPQAQQFYAFVFRAQSATQTQNVVLKKKWLELLFHSELIIITHIHRSVRWKKERSDRDRAITRAVKIANKNNNEK